MKKFLISIFLFFSISCAATAAVDIYHFDSSEQQMRFLALTSQLRCLVCQNQNLAESNASLAEDLRNQIFQQMKSGQTDKQIIAYLVTRYGDFILYRPPLNAGTFALWVAPIILLLSGLGYLIFYIRKQRD